MSESFNCKHCNLSFIPKNKEYNTFCSRSCAASFNNRLRKKSQKSCLNCSNSINRRRIYCSHKCQQAFSFKQKIEDWKLGKVTFVGNEVSQTIKRYLISHHQGCELCGWNKLNIKTQKSPLQIHHKNGDAKDNSYENLELLCPNCHSLTENFGAFNKGKGRKARYGALKQN